MKKPENYSSGENYFYYKRILLIIKLSVFMLITGFLELNAGEITPAKMSTETKSGDACRPLGCISLVYSR